MESFACTVECISGVCRASNDLREKFCHRCGLPLVKLYLWTINDIEGLFKPGDLVSGRYLCKSSKVFLDKMPGLMPEAVNKLPRFIQPYLKLSNIAPHVPQVFGKLIQDQDIWLLEYGTVPIGVDGEPIYLELLPPIEQIWSNATPLQQLSWLIQIVKLWEPLNSQGVVSTLIDPNLLRINGNFVQLLQLNYDHIDLKFSLKDLANLWRNWSTEASSSIRTFLYDICEKLENGEIAYTRSLVSILENAQKEFYNFYKWSYSLFTLSDKGPSREQNEDCCYPQSSTLLISTDEFPDLLALVCDGIGGHDSGEIASQMATDSLKALPQSLAQSDNIHHAIQEAIVRTNNLIWQRNALEMRTEFQRMGTTLVMGLVKLNYLYLASVGDSRIYWITRESCLRLNADDDVASCSVRYGVSLYREAVNLANSGALTQALGTTSPTELYPNVQHQLPTEDCLILLTSDGLSDSDRVEQYWQSEFLPLLESQRELTEVGVNLINIANEKNGHDNTTIALILCRLIESQDLKDFSLSLPIVYASNPVQTEKMPINIPSQNQTRPITSPRQQTKKNTNRHSFILIGFSFILASVTAGFLFILFSNNHSSKQEIQNTSKIGNQQ